MKKRPLVKAIIISAFLVATRAWGEEDFLDRATRDFRQNALEMDQQMLAAEMDQRMRRLENARLVELRRQQQIEDAKRIEEKRVREAEIYYAQQREKAAREKAKADEAQAQSQQQQPIIQPITSQRRAEFNKEVEQSKAEAIRLYPDVTISTSALSRRVTEIANRLEAEKNPILYYSTAPLRVTQMAALELGISPAE
jgi:hypothetical protein